MVTAVALDYTEQEDREFISGVYTMHKGLMYSVALKYTSDKDECEDILQDALLKLIRNVNTLKRMSHYAMLEYISLTVKSAALNFLQKKSKIVSISVCMPDMELTKMLDSLSSGYSAEDITVKKDTSERIFRAVESLPEKQRMLLVGKYYLELSNDELAEMAGCAPTSVRMLLMRSRQALCKKLKKEGFFYES